MSEHSRLKMQANACYVACMLSPSEANCCGCGFELLAFGTLLLLMEPAMGRLHLGRVRSSGAGANVGT